MSCLATQFARRPHIHLGEMRLRRLEVEEDDVPMASMDNTAARTANKSGRVSVHLTTNEDGKTSSPCDSSRALDGLFDAVAGRSVGVSTPRNRLVLHANCSLHDGGRSVSSAVHRRNDDRRMCNGIIVVFGYVSYGFFRRVFGREGIGLVGVMWCGVAWWRDGRRRWGLSGKSGRSRWLGGLRDLVDAQVVGRTLAFGLSTSVVGWLEGLGACTKSRTEGRTGE